MRQPVASVHARRPLSGSTLLKILLALFVGGLLVALILDSSPGEARRKWIEAAIKSGRIGRMSPARSAYLRTVLAGVAEQAKLDGTIVLNSTDQPNSLHVYTIDPGTESITGCGRGNAVYDATQDAIFLDESLVDPVDFLNLGEETQHSNSITTDDIAPLKTYLVFLLFHELGHRTLHRHAKASFDVGRSTDRRREIEADQFAVSLLTKSLMDRSPLTSSIFAKNYLYGVALTPELPPRDRAWLALVDMAHFISVSTMFSATPIAATYHDAAHPSFLDRSESIIDNALIDRDCSSTLREYFRLAREAITRARSIAEYRVVELVFPEPIYDVAFTVDGLVVVPENSAHLYRLTPRDLPTLEKSETRTVIVPQAAAVVGTGFPQLGPAATADYSWSATWNTRSGETYALRPGQTFLSRGEFWRHASPEIETRLAQYSLQQVVTPPQPSSVAILEAATPSHTNILISLCDGRICAVRETQAIVAETNLNGELAFLNTVTDDYTYLAIYSGTPNGGVGSLRGVIVLDSRTLVIRRVAPLGTAFCSEAGSESAAVWDPLSFVVVPAGNNERFFCIASPHATADRWYAVEVFPGNRASETVVSAPFIVGVLHKRKEELNDFEVRNYRPSGYHSSWIGGERVLVQLFNDSAWLLDVGTRRATILFHPGGEATRIAVGHESVVVFYRSGYKCYVVEGPDVDENPGYLQ